MQAVASMRLIRRATKGPRILFYFETDKFLFVILTVHVLIHLVSYNLQSQIRI